MTAALLPDIDMANQPSAQMSASLLTRRSSRSSGSQSGHRTSRIEKPRSNHNSPRTVERRKTTSSSKRYATLDDHFNMMFGLAGEEDFDDDREEDKRDASRPMSWHPSSAQFQVPSRSSIMSDHAHNYTAPSRNSAHGSDFYSLSARNSMFTDQFQTHAPSQDAHRGSQDSDNSCQSQPSGSYSYSSISTPATESMPWYLQEWTRKNNTAVTTSHNGSSDFLPIQHPSAIEADDDDEDMEDSGKELVGMGLYDLPESSLAWNSSTLLEGTGKGLKLEETWQPPEEDEDDEEQEADDASSDDGSVEELPTAKENTQLPLPNGSSKPQIPGNMEGQSFFFDEDETYKTEWWFRQLKQPSVPVRDAGLGYGWL